MMINKYTRIPVNGTALYIRPDLPDWFIPNKSADKILVSLQEGNSPEQAAAAGGCSRAEADRLLGRLRLDRAPEYTGRSSRDLTGLKELWLHLTNRCNMRCTHCLFGCSPESTEQMTGELLFSAIEEALTLGVRVFYFTGGEPTLHPDLLPALRMILDREGTHAVILTNGKLLAPMLPELQMLPGERLHFQLSIDGDRESHNSLRGEGAWEELMAGLEILRNTPFAVTLAMSVTRQSLSRIGALVDLAAEKGVRSIHLLWLFLKGNADESLFVSPKEILPELTDAYRKSLTEDVLIDNVELLKGQLFSLPGTRYDLSNSAWESVAIGPDGTLYPSPALVLDRTAAAGSLSDGLERTWRESAILQKHRNATATAVPELSGDPWRFLLGGGDPDHSLTSGGQLCGADPYLPLYRGLAEFLLTEEAGRHPDPAFPGLLCRMGERVESCDPDAGSVGFSRSNCVLSIPGKDGHSLVRDFYSNAAKEVNTEIINPVGYDTEQLQHIPEKNRVRSYGCGSPVHDCNPESGETVVDLGSGSGVECFIAAKAVGTEGQVFGIDMSDTMLAAAQNAAAEVGKELGYSNVRFLKGFLESLPLEDNCADAVISNCVLNLSPDKRKVLAEARRILKPGGRLCISDIVRAPGIPLRLLYNEKMRGECLGGAMTEPDLYGLLRDLGFRSLRLLKRFLYREVEGFHFYSVTYLAQMETPVEMKTMIYRGPLESVCLNGVQMHPGIPVQIPLPPDYTPGEDFFLLNKAGNVTNVVLEQGCCTFTPALPEKEMKTDTGCLVCGAPLRYPDKPARMSCAICGLELETQTVCEQGHFVCDSCHSKDAIKVIRNICLTSDETDMTTLYTTIREHPAIPLHGPEHHSLIPAVILTAYRNMTGKTGETELDTALERGKGIPGGSCAFKGICGAAAGVGTAFSIILGANPYTPVERQQSMQSVVRAAKKIATIRAARCCLRDGWSALQAAAELSEEVLGIRLTASPNYRCTQYPKNRECAGKACPLFP